MTETNTGATATLEPPKTLISAGLIVPEVAETEQHFITQEISVLDIARLSDGIELISRERGNFDNKEAANFLSLPKFIGERPFRKPWLEHLMAEVKQGTFRAESTQIITCEVKGWKQPRRMNGQHTAWMVMNRANQQKGFALKGVEFLHYTAKDERFMRTLYATIDAGAARSQGNKLVSLLAGTSNFNDIPSDVLRRLGEGLAFLLWPRKRGQHDAKHRAHMMVGEYQRETREIGSSLASHASREARHLLRGPVIAAMYGTFHIAPGRGQRSAYVFWDGVRSGSHLDERDGRMRLFKYLLTSAVSDRGSMGDKQKVGRTMM